MPFLSRSALLIALFAALPALAQDDLSVDELVGLWSRQKTMFQEARSNGLGRTRGLELINIDQSGTETGASVAAAPGDPNRPLTGGQAAEFGRLAPELQVNLQINFGFDSATVAASERPKLQKICNAMALSDVRLFRIVGHTDTAGSDEYNERLSLMRAKEVVRYLVDDCGIDAARLEPLGMGERFPFNPRNTRADENRRVEFQALS